jgi:ribosome-associated translation inhibitor RaiA
MDSTDAVNAYATEKVAKLQKFLRQPLKGQVTLSCQQNRLHSAEVDVHAGHEHFHAHETS